MDTRANMSEYSHFAAPSCSILADLPKKMARIQKDIESNTPKDPTPNPSQHSQSTVTSAPILAGLTEEISQTSAKILSNDTYTKRLAKMSKRHAPKMSSESSSSPIQMSQPQKNSFGVDLREFLHIGHPDRRRILRFQHQGDGWTALRDTAHRGSQLEKDVLRKLRGSQEFIKMATTPAEKHLPQIKKDQSVAPSAKKSLLVKFKVSPLGQAPSPTMVAIQHLLEDMKPSVNQSSIVKLKASPAVFLIPPPDTQPAAITLEASTSKKIKIKLTIKRPPTLPASVTPAVNKQKASLDIKRPLTSTKKEILNKVADPSRIIKHVAKQSPPSSVAASSKIELIAKRPSPKIVHWRLSPEVIKLAAEFAAKRSLHSPTAAPITSPTTTPKIELDAKRSSPTIITWQPSTEAYRLAAELAAKRASMSPSKPILNNLTTPAKVTKKSTSPRKSPANSVSPQDKQPSPETNTVIPGAWKTPGISHNERLKLFEQEMTAREQNHIPNPNPKPTRFSPRKAEKGDEEGPKSRLFKIRNGQMERVYRSGEEGQREQEKKMAQEEQQGDSSANPSKLDVEMSGDSDLEELPDEMFDGPEFDKIKQKFED